MTVYHWQELVEPTYIYKTTEREVKSFSLSYSPGYFGFPEDAFPFEEYTIPTLIYNHVNNLLVKYLGDSTDIIKYLDFGIISQYLFINMQNDEAGKYIDEVKSTIQKLQDLSCSFSETRNISVENITIKIGRKTLKIDSWLFIATYLGSIKSTLKNLSTGKILDEFEYEKYDDSLLINIKKTIYPFLIDAFEEKNTKPHGKFVFTGIFCHLFQIPVSVDEKGNCILTNDKDFTAYKPFGDAIKKMIRRERGQTKI